MSEHFQIQCPRCAKIIAQCRCAGTRKIEYRHCAECLAEMKVGGSCERYREEIKRLRRVIESIAGLCSHELGTCCECCEWLTGLAKRALAATPKGLK